MLSRMKTETDLLRDMVLDLVAKATTREDFRRAIWHLERLCDSSTG